MVDWSMAWSIWRRPGRYGNKSPQVISWLELNWAHNLLRCLCQSTRSHHSRLRAPWPFTLNIRCATKSQIQYGPSKTAPWQFPAYLLVTMERCLWTQTPYLLCFDGWGRRWALWGERYMSKLFRVVLLHYRSYTKQMHKCRQSFIHVISFDRLTNDWLSCSS